MSLSWSVSTNSDKLHFFTHCHSVASFLYIADIESFLSLFHQRLLNIFLVLSSAVCMSSFCTDMLCNNIFVLKWHSVPDKWHFSARRNFIAFLSSNLFILIFFAVHVSLHWNTWSQLTLSRSMLLAIPDKLYFPISFSVHHLFYAHLNFELIHSLVQWKTSEWKGLEKHFVSISLSWIRCSDSFRATFPKFLNGPLFVLLPTDYSAVTYTYLDFNVLKRQHECLWQYSSLLPSSWPDFPKTF